MLLEMRMRLSNVVELRVVEDEGAVDYQVNPFFSFSSLQNAVPLFQVHVLLL